jgi:Rho-type GTPase-activating protein 1/2
MFDGLSVAQGEYDNEVASRRDAEAEVSRLRLQLATQSAELTALNANQRKRDLMEKLSKDMSDSLHGLERDLSKLKAERDLTLAEVEELVSKREYVYGFTQTYNTHAFDVGESIQMNPPCYLGP